MLSMLKQFASDLYQAYRNWQEDDGSQMAASVSFYMAVSFFPLLLVLISLTGLVLRFSGWGQNARQRLLALIGEQTAPALAEQVESVLSNVQNGSVVSGPIGLFTLLLGAIAVFVHVDDAMDRIWNAQRPARKGLLAILRNLLVERLRAFLMLLGVAVLVVAGFLASMVLSAMGKYASAWVSMPPGVWNLITLCSTIGLNWFSFTVIYKILPKVPVRWSEAARGALFTALMWEAGRRVLAALVIGSKFGVYGVVGAFVAIMLWMFYATAIMFLGAEYIRVFCANCHARSGASSR